MRKKRWLLPVGTAVFVVAAGFFAYFWPDSEPKREAKQNVTAADSIAPPDESDKKAASSELKLYEENNASQKNGSPVEKYNYYFQRSRLLGESGKYQEALDSLGKAESAGAPVSYLLYVDKGRIYQYLGNNNQARVSYQKSIDLAEMQIPDEETKSATLMTLKSQLERVP